MSEIDLASKFVEYLSDFDLYFEVKVFGRVADIVAIKRPVVMSVEVKTSFSLAVISQAFDNKMFYTYSYVAVPQSKGNGMAIKICENYGIGVLLYDAKYNRVREVVKPQINRKALTKYVEVFDYNKKAVPGCVHGRPTPFKEMIADITRFLQKNNGATFKEVFENSYVTYHSLSAFKSGIYQWTRKGVIRDFYVQNARIFLCQ